jgi:hypothetical protein
MLIALKPFKLGINDFKPIPVQYKKFLLLEQPRCQRQPPEKEGVIIPLPSFGTLGALG